MLEKQIENYLTAAVKRIGGKAYKWISPGNVGVPDRIVMVNGRVYFVELKGANGFLSPVQRSCIRKIEEHIREKVWVLKSYPEIEEFIEFVRKGGVVDEI